MFLVLIFYRNFKSKTLRNIKEKLVDWKIKKKGWKCLLVWESKIVTRKNRIARMVKEKKLDIRHEIIIL